MANNDAVVRELKKIREKLEVINRSVWGANKETVKELKELKKEIRAL